MTQGSQRTRKRLQGVFMQLVREQGYAATTIGQVADRAGVARSTVYRYFEDKIDLLLSIHTTMFESLTIDLNTRTAWLADQPPESVVTFFSRFSPGSAAAMGMYQSVGDDLLILMARIDDLLAAQFEHSLQTCFANDSTSIPIPVLARGIAGVYRWLLGKWLTRKSPYTPEQICGYAHRCARAMITDAMSTLHTSSDFTATSG